ncbi:xanthine dehydrogenase family protein molybdopterin-binding subunit [Compostibacter hankyongensis]|uniref:Xanthine dehydrogenase family protein molybdopterin-binding subunit n=1 Tax=Compostibacter hankyongensis TaxID=1007089 RepID=A0ABP8FM32_9BACT
MSTSRRNFLKTAGCLTIGFSIGGGSFACSPPSSGKLPRSLSRFPALDSWITVLADGRVRIMTGKLELGQGIRTAIAQVAAEELNLGMENVTVDLAETGHTPDEGYTAGSGSIEGSAMSVRYAAAYAREKLLQLAADELKVRVSELRTAHGRISTVKGTPAITFAALLKDRQLNDEVRMPVTLKSRDRYQLVGKPVPREDIGRMVRAGPVYVHNLRFPGMVHARMIRPPVYGARLLQLDQGPVKRHVPGLLKIVVNGSFLGVIAEDEYSAIQAQSVLRGDTHWSVPPPFPEAARTDLPAYLKTLPVQTQQVAQAGDTAPAENGVVSLKAAYFKPYIMHGAIGPSCAVAFYNEDMLHVWTHSQGVYPLRETLQKMLDMPAEKIHVKGVPGSGCYGHNGADDAAADAALLAMALPGRHVRLQWSREEEHSWEPYGSAMVMEAEAGLDADGRIVRWQYDLWSDSHGSRPGGEPGNLLPARYLATPFPPKAEGFSGGAHRNAEPYYRIPNREINAHFFDGPLRTSALRSLGAFANIFAIESFMDELAEKAGKDPYTFRLMHLDDERAKAVIRKVQELTSGQGAGPGSGMGLAFSRYKNSASYCAVVARVSADPEAGSIRVQKMWAVIDAGEVINPDGLKNQTEGGMIQSASWTLKEEVQFDEKRIVSTDWNLYPVFRFSEVPEVEVTVLDRPETKAMGAGEAVQGPASAAIANAVYRACGKRIRRLPLLHHMGS